jgi:hypothetical protein
MRTVSGIVLAGVLSGVATIGSVATVNAQYYYPPPSYGYPPPSPYGSGPYNPCPMGYTVQGGVCQPYRGPVGGRWRGSGPYNPCPMGYTVQDGVCKPYRGY